jgi:ankyrin repeat protein
MTPLNPLDAELVHALDAGDAARALAAIEAGADVNVQDPRPLLGHGNTPLHYAASCGHVELVRELLRLGADVDARCNSGWTPLMRACNAEHPGVAEILLDAGADPHLANSEGYTAWGRIPLRCVELVALFRARNATTADERGELLRNR